MVDCIYTTCVKIRIWAIEIPSLTHHDIMVDIEKMVLEGPCDLKFSLSTSLFVVNTTTRIKTSVSAVYGVISWGTTIRFMTCRAALQRFRDFTKLSCAAGPRFRKLFLSWRESRALPLKFVQSRYGLGQHCMCNNVVPHLWFWPSFVTVFVVLMLCVKAHSL